ncbi:hypothetical protein FBD94_15345 [Pedobacter hiemivivus]|uniref:Uncharacterized protein n=1 Tax=Pedobacter hiemivivus TaxID=2530454 RepID=A0A4U1GBK5_9SPHI|nr:hypothetical protein [Pedobacter hiemivivus]TKC60279.1 hypothetical protein FBD94_15345 [Pedobacter hiemivivus]
MEQKTSFKIFNNSNSDLELIHEPESFIFNLPINEEVIVEMDSCRESIQLKMSVDNGKAVIAILDENSLYRISHNGEDIFEKYL